ncbi:MAG: uroporphyrinogen decarboxylase family protein [Anaerofustis sp.]
MSNIETTYQERITRIDNVLSNKLPDRVPILSTAETWQLHYAGVNLRKAFTEDADLCFKAYKKYADDIFFDAFHSIGNVCPVNFTNMLGGGMYTMTEDSLQTSTGKAQKMLGSEYADLIADPIRFVATKIIPRKFDIFNKPVDEIYDTFSAALEEYDKFNQLNGTVVKKVVTELGIPFISAGCCSVTVDILEDYLRDFSGIIGDIRRHPEEVCQAGEALFDWSYRIIVAAYPNPRQGVGVMSPLHLATYLKPKDFEKFYLPYLIKMISAFTEKGYGMFLFMENDWTPYLEMLQDLPDGKILGLFEYGDLKKYKSSIGNKICVAGGMPTNILNHYSKEECIEYAKKIIDELAPGGRYIFAVDRSLLSLNDCNAENLKAVNEFVRNYARY